jgi:hypothetical protein
MAREFILFCRVLFSVILVFLLSGCFDPPESDYVNSRTCYARMKAVSLALEEYQIRNNTPLEIFSARDLETLVEEGFLSKVPATPGYPDNGAYYRADEYLTVWNLKYGVPGGICKTLKKERCEEFAEEQGRKRYKTHSIVYNHENNPVVQSEILSLMGPEISQGTIDRILHPGGWPAIKERRCKEAASHIQAALIKYFLETGEFIHINGKEKLWYLKKTGYLTYLPPLDEINYFYSDEMFNVWHCHFGNLAGKCKKSISNDCERAVKLSKSNSRFHYYQEYW